MTPELLLRGGRIIDGGGAPSFVGDVAVEAGRIVAVGGLGAIADTDARAVVDARGWAVAPGFIDVHSHGDVTVVADPRARSAIAQGVTTVVVGNCGHSPAPLPIPAALPELTFGFTDEPAPTWTTFGEYLEALEAVRPAVNVASLAGHNALRVAALGHTPREASAAEQRVMVRELERAMEAGAFGLSSGLEYPLGTRSTTEELVLLASTAGRHAGIFALHTRDRDFHAVEAFDEAFAIAERSGTPLQISHIAPRRGAPDGALVDVLGRIDRARADGLDVSCDQHTRLHGITKLTTMLPPSASAVGTDELLRQLRDPRARASFHEFREPIHKLGLLGEWDRLALFESRATPDLVGKDFATIGRERGQHPLDAMMDILLEAGEDAPNVLFIGLVQTQEDLDLTFASSTCSPESDATTLSTDGPLADQRFLGAYTWAAYYLGRIVRERAVLSLEEGVRRLTRVPAERVGLPDRGTLTPGAWADITIFDPDAIVERGTVAKPNAFPAGVHHVYVNGELAFEDGRFADERSGQVIRRPQRGIPISEPGRRTDDDHDRARSNRGQ